MENLGRTTRVVAAECFMVDGDDDLLNFSLDGEEDADEEKNNFVLKGSTSFSSSNPIISHDEDFSRSSSFPEFLEKELEWLSNKDAFPSVETCFDIFSENPDGGALDQQSPVSVLENSSSSNGNSSGNGSTIVGCCVNFQVPTSFPIRARNKRRRRRRTGFGDLPSQQFLSWNQVNVKSNKQGLALVVGGDACIAKLIRPRNDAQVHWGQKRCAMLAGCDTSLGDLCPASSPTFSAKLCEMGVA